MTLVEEEEEEEFPTNTANAFSAESVSRFRSLKAEIMNCLLGDGLQNNDQRNKAALTQSVKCSQDLFQRFASKMSEIEEANYRELQRTIASNPSETKAREDQLRALLNEMTQMEKQWLQPHIATNHCVQHYPQSVLEKVDDMVRKCEKLMSDDHASQSFQQFNQFLSWLENDSDFESLLSYSSYKAGTNQSKSPTAPKDVDEFDQELKQEVPASQQSALQTIEVDNTRDANQAMIFQLDEYVSQINRLSDENDALKKQVTELKAQTREQQQALEKEKEAAQERDKKKKKPWFSFFAPADDKADTIQTPGKMTAKDASDPKHAKHNAGIVAIKDLPDTGTPGMVGLANLGNSDAINAILQCLSSTSDLRSYFIDSTYKQDISLNPVSTGGQLANEFANLLTHLWRRNHKCFAAESFRLSLAQLDITLLAQDHRHDSLDFLTCFLNGLHQDLNNRQSLVVGNNLCNNNPFVDESKYDDDGDDGDELDEDLSNDETQLAQASLRRYLSENRSKIVELFHSQLRLQVSCLKCGHSEVSFEPYMWLSVPVGARERQTIILDVFHLKEKANVGANKPVRHVFHVNSSDTVSVLANAVATLYNCHPSLVLIAQHRNGSIRRQMEPSDLLQDLPHTPSVESVPYTAMAAHVLTDWNQRLACTRDANIRARIQNGAGLSLQLVRLTQVGPFEEYYKQQKYGADASVDRSDPGRGSPFMVCGLNVTTHREFYQLIYERLYLWVGSCLQQFGMLPPPGPDVGADEAQLRWEQILANLPFKLLDAAKWQFGELPVEIGIDDTCLSDALKSEKQGGDYGHWFVEWRLDVWSKVGNVIDRIVADKEYTRWKRSAQNRENDRFEVYKNANIVTLEDCLDSFVTPVVSEKSWCCSKCDNELGCRRKVDMWGFPEVLVIHLKRFVALGNGMPVQRIGDMVDFEKRLDLNKFVVNGDMHENDEPVYELYAVCNHSERKDLPAGEVYSAYAWNDIMDQWYYFEDDQVYPVKEEEVVTKDAYILFYKKVR